MYRDFINADFNSINKDLKLINWNNFKNLTNINDQIALFYQSIFSNNEKHVKWKKTKNHNHPKWFDKIAINLKNQMNKLHKRFRHADSLLLQQKYCEKRTEYKKYIRKRYYEYKLEIQQLIDEDPQCFLNILKTPNLA